MEKSNKRGKIPQSDWPLIMARYEAGETLASIARTYDCSPPAISYVVSKSRARQPARDNSATGSSGTESQLIKAIARELAASSGGQSRHGAPIGRIAQIAGQATERRAEAMSTESDTAPAPATPPMGIERDHQTGHRTDGPHHDNLAGRGPHPSAAHASGATGNGQPAPIGTGQWPTTPSPPLRDEADTRHRLHLSPGNGAASHNGSGDLKFPSSARSVPDTQSVTYDGRPAQAHAAGLSHPAPRRPDAPGFSEAGPGPAPPPHQIGREAGSDTVSRKQDTAAFIDHELRARVDTDIAAFLSAFDAALVQDTQENRFALREATDRLLRAGARTRIELERLEARVPLTAHERGYDPAGAWRYR
jgi:hypothetical protein